ncbi:MAG: NAD-dependent epimerase/dehydratase family protein [Opitutaceae bacterium]|nr:NAD-dependent epimerase/dehydratase family protein [Opitutaceae bacterium]
MSESSHRFFAGKRLFVAGCGYVGREVARRGIKLGLSVTALTRNPAKAADLQAEGICTIVADLADESWHDQLPAEIDFVLNSVSSGGGGVEGYRRSYYEGMASILKWAAQAKVGTCVYTSSTSVYPQGDGATVDETAPLGEPADERTQWLIKTEALLRESTAVGRSFILRLAGIYGPGRHHVLDQIRAGGALPGNGEHRLNLIHRDDAAAAVWTAFGAAPEVGSAVYNVADDHPVAKAAFATWVAAQLGQDAPQFDPTLPSRRRRVVPDRVIRNAKIKQELGWQPRYPDYRAGYTEILATL